MPFYTTESLRKRGRVILNLTKACTRKMRRTDPSRFRCDAKRRRKTALRHFEFSSNVNVRARNKNWNKISMSHTYRYDIHEGSLSTVLQTDESELHLFLPEEGLEPVQNPIDKSQHVESYAGSDPAPFAVSLNPGKKLL